MQHTAEEGDTGAVRLGICRATERHLQGRPISRGLASHEGVRGATGRDIPVLSDVAFSHGLPADPGKDVEHLG